MIMWYYNISICDEILLIILNRNESKEQPGVSCTWQNTDDISNMCNAYNSIFKVHVHLLRV